MRIKEGKFEIMLIYVNNILIIGNLGSKINITLKDNIPFNYRPYTITRTEQDAVKQIAVELMEIEIVKDSETDYAFITCIVSSQKE